MESERPDEELLRRTIEALERNIGDFNIEDELGKDGGTAVIDGQEVFLTTLEANVTITDEERGNVPGNIVDWMFEEFFEQLALFFRNMIDDGGYNVCRPLGIVDPNLTAEKGVLQLCKRGEKISLYMKHKYHGDRTEVTLLMLVGKV